MDSQHLKDTSKLPKWARDHIEALTREAQRLEDENKLLRGEKKLADTNVFIRNHGGAGDIPLPKGSAILFKTGEHIGDYIEVAFDRPRTLSALDNSGQAVQVRCGGGALVVIPDCRNGAHVKQVHGDIVGTK